MELKKCPFCGGEAILEELEEMSFIECKNCYVSMPGTDSEEAIESWNTRYKEDET